MKNNRGFPACTCCMFTPDRQNPKICGLCRHIEDEHATIEVRYFAAERTLLNQIRHATCDLCPAAIAIIFAFSTMGALISLFFTREQWSSSYSYAWVAVVAVAIIWVAFWVAYYCSGYGSCGESFLISGSTSTAIASVSFDTTTDTPTPACLRDTCGCRNTYRLIMVLHICSTSIILLFVVSEFFKSSQHN